ncbi:helix-turn-helix domain-containing protein, partial [Streptomyces sp. Act-28]
MPRWKALPDELDPCVREFTDTLRRLVERGGLDLDALADRTGYGRASWERYLDGRLPVPGDAVLVLAEVTGADPAGLTALRELAESARNRAGTPGDRGARTTRVTPGAPTAAPGGGGGPRGGGG